MRLPVDVKLDYLTLTLDLVNEKAKAAASPVYEQECGASLRELRLMRFIGAEPGLTLTRLIELCSLEKTLASKGVSALVARGWVTRSVGTVDARHISLELTDGGEDVVLRADPIGRLMEQKLLHRLSPNELAVFKRCLDKLVVTADEMSVWMEDLPASLKREPAL